MRAKKRRSFGWVVVLLSFVAWLGVIFLLKPNNFLVEAIMYILLVVVVMGGIKIVNFESRVPVVLGWGVMVLLLLSRFEWLNPASIGLLLVGVGLLSLRS